MYRLSLLKQHVNIDTVIDDINPYKIDVHLVQLSKKYTTSPPTFNRRKRFLLV